MDLLQRELQRKKKALARATEEVGSLDDGSAKDGHNDNRTNKKTKYLRVGELRRIQEEQEDEERRLLQKKRQHTTDSVTPSFNTEADVGNAMNIHKDDNKKKWKKKRRVDNGNSDHQTSQLGTNKQSLKSESSTLAITVDDEGNPRTHHAEEDMIQQFRQLGLPIRLFGESREARATRLQKALEQQTHMLQGVSEMEEFRLGRGHGIRNQFLEKETTDDTNENHVHRDNMIASSNTTTKDGGSMYGNEDGNRKPNNESSVSAEGDRNTRDGTTEDDDPEDLPKRIYAYFKGLLKQWEEDLSLRPDHIKKSVAGKNESKTLKQCKDYIRPLFKLCKTRRLEPGMEAHLIKIVTFAKDGEFVSAHDAYMDVAIGRAAWPIGVTMVGIHARSGRAKIESANVAHVMNSELQRKYLTSVKRLLTYAQKKRTDVDPSKKVL